MQCFKIANETLYNEKDKLEIGPDRNAAVIITQVLCSLLNESPARRKDTPTTQFMRLHLPEVVNREKSLPGRLCFPQGKGKTEVRHLPHFLQISYGLRYRSVSKDIESHWPFGSSPHFSMRDLQTCNQKHIRILRLLSTVWKEKYKARCWLKTHRDILGLDLNEIISHSGPHHKSLVCTNAWSLLQWHTFVVERIAAKKGW